MLNLFKKNLFLLLIIFLSLVFFNKVFLGFVPIPADTIVGLYHPFRDVYVKDYPNGIPFKNFLVTDPVRQIYPWKQLSMESIQKMSLPLWNPYEMSGTPHFANFQSSALYPLNVLLLIKPFVLSWTVFIVIQTILISLFTFLYLRNLKLDDRAALLGAVSFGLCGFTIAWLEWGNVIHTALWLPLILLSIDKVLSEDKRKNIWSLIFLTSLIFSFFAGHLQVFFYVLTISAMYLIFRWVNYGMNISKLISLLGLGVVFVLLTAVQWIPTLQFINLSARSIDQNYQTIEGWFVPYVQLVQFLVPDFFGNPTTLNYWGEWNYAEFVGYVGVITLFFAIFSLFSYRRKEILFFATLTILGLILAVPNFISELPYKFSIPFLSTAQPTRLIFVVSFSICVLASFGLDKFVSLQNREKKYFYTTFALFLVSFGILWLVAVKILNLDLSPQDLEVAKRNLVIPTITLFLGLFISFVYILIPNKLVKNYLILLIILIVFIDLFRFGTKFTPFTNPEYLFPTTKIIKYIQNDKELFRVATTDSSIFPPNFSTHYKIQSIEGYDPLYLKSYAELVAAMERGKPDISSPFGFNRIITPRNIDSSISALLNVKYILSFNELDPEKYRKVLEEGKTKLFINDNYLERAFFVENTVEADGREAIERMFNSDLAKTAIVESGVGAKSYTIGKVVNLKYKNDRIEIETDNEGEAFMVLTDNYYPTWKVTIDGVQSKIYRTNHTFRGVKLSAGKHKIIFYNSLF